MGIIHAEEKKAEYVNGASEKYEVTPSRTSENALLASRNACQHPNLFICCQLVEFVLVNEFLIQKLERVA